MDSQGVPVRNAKVVLSKGSNEIAAGVSDGVGRFHLGPASGGVYTLHSSGRANLVRAWRAGTAPPAAGDMALVVVDDEVIRGQMPLEDFFASDAFLITALLVAAIAVPIAVHNSRNNSPSSP